ncbi:11263_t:CDS:2, partial [Paraglomus brasilianum]
MAVDIFTTMNVNKGFAIYTEQSMTHGSDFSLRPEMPKATCEREK